MSEVVEHPRLVRARADAEAMLRFLEERMAAGDCARAILYVETTIEADPVDENLSTHADVFVAKRDGNGDAFRFGGAPDGLASSFERRVRPSRSVPDPYKAREMELLREDLAAPVADVPTSLPPPRAGQALVAELQRSLLERIARCRRPDALSTTVRASLRLRWRFYSDLKSRMERTDLEVVIAVEHRIRSETAPTRLYGEELSPADLEDGVGASWTSRHVPTAEDLDALVIEALIAGTSNSSTPRDPLTGAWRRARWAATLIEATSKGSAWCAIANVDHMKRFNAHNGHVRGDEVLRRLGAHFVVNADEAEVVRIAGDSFALIWAHDDERRAVTTSEALLKWARDALTPEQPLDCGESGCLGPRQLSLSMGLARVPAQEGPDAVHARLDAALIEAKLGGGDRVVMAARFLA